MTDRSTPPSLVGEAERLLQTEQEKTLTHVDRQPTEPRDPTASASEGQLPSPVNRRQSAGDLLCEAFDQLAQHGTACELDNCRTCDVLFNRARLAHKVWASSRHKNAAVINEGMLAALRGVIDQLTVPFSTPDTIARAYVGAVCIAGDAITKAEGR